MGAVAFWLLLIAVVVIVVWKARSNSDKFRVTASELAMLTMQKKISPQESKSLNLRLLRGKNYRIGELNRHLEILRESIDIALMSKKKDIATSRMDTVTETWRLINDKYIELLSDDVKKYIGSVVDSAYKNFQTDMYLNMAQGHIDKAYSLKTEKSRNKYKLLACDVLREGLENPTSDKDKIKAKLFLIENSMQ